MSEPGLIVIATKHPPRAEHRDVPHAVPSLHLIAHDLDEYMQWRAAVILGIRVLSVTMECGWNPNCFMRRSDVKALRTRGIIVPDGIGWVQCEFQEGSEPPPLWFFHGRYGAILRDKKYRFLCRRDESEPEVIGLLPRDKFPPQRWDWGMKPVRHGVET